MIAKAREHYGITEGAAAAKEQVLRVVSFLPPRFGTKGKQTRPCLTIA